MQIALSEWDAGVFREHYQADAGRSGGRLLACLSLLADWCRCLKCICSLNVCLRGSVLCFLLAAVHWTTATGAAQEKQVPAEWAEKFDAAMSEFVELRQITAATLAVSFDGKTIIEKAYGSSRVNGKRRRTRVDDPFRIASISKPMTAAVVYQLIDSTDGLELDSPVFEYLKISEYEDPRCSQITVRHLLEHKSGWDNKALGFDPMFESPRICRELGINEPADPAATIRFMLRRRLASDPGTKESYSNFGYCLLGRVIEQASGKSYADALDNLLFEPLEMDSAALGRSLARHRQPGEPTYVHPGKTRNVVDPGDSRPVTWPYGGFCLETMDAHGGIICSAPDLIRFLDAYWIGGKPRAGKGYTYTFFGSLPGTYTMARQHVSGFNVVALFNQRTDASALPYDDIKTAMDEVIEGLTKRRADNAVSWQCGE